MTNHYIKMLYDEHEVIVNAIDVARQMKPLIEKNPELYDANLHKLIKFFRNYADKFHHYKEEIILFPEMNKRNELLADGVIKEMFENHEDFREMIRGIENNLNEKNYVKAHALLVDYTEQLLDHIAVENDEVFQMAETIFDKFELERIGHRFMDCDRQLGEDIKEELRGMAEQMRKDLYFGD